MPEIMTSSNVIEGAYGGMRSNAGVPSNGTSEVQTLTIGGTPTATASSTIQFKKDGGTISTGALWSATNNTLVANIQADLDALFDSGIITVAVGTMTAGVGTITLTYGGSLAKMNVPALTAINNLTGTSPTAAITTTTPGVNATHRGAPGGTLCIDSTNADMYTNHGTASAPSWLKVTAS